MNESSRPADGSVDFAHVTFGYDPANPVLKDWSMHINDGEMVTLAGRTGAGKTTMFRLILGLYGPQKGNVTVCGIPAGRLSDQTRRSEIGCVEQRFILIPGTIRDQITLHDSSITDAQVCHALELTGMKEEVEKAGGLDAPCTSSMFSQGQFQLLSIARAVVCDPKILLLDEITANLDSLTEKNVLEALSNASKGRTTISISHRLYEHAGGRLILLDQQ